MRIKSIVSDWHNIEINNISAIKEYPERERHMGARTCIALHKRSTNEAGSKSSIDLVTTLSPDEINALIEIDKFSLSFEDKLNEKN